MILLRERWQIEESIIKKAVEQDIKTDIGLKYTTTKEEVDLFSSAGYIPKGEVCFLLLHKL